MLSLLVFDRSLPPVKKSPPGVKKKIGGKASPARQGRCRWPDLPKPGLARASKRNMLS